MDKQKHSEKVQPILVYTDFTSTGNKAVEWAVFLCREMSRRLILLHVVDHNTAIMSGNTDAYLWAKKKISELKASIELLGAAKVNTYVEEGCNCTLISRTAEEEDVIFGIVGVHGKNDPQYLSGTTVLKMARRSRIPFLFLGERTPNPASLGNIAFPLNFQKQMKEKVAWGIFLSKHLHREVEIITPEKNDELQNNILFTNKMFQQLNIKFRHNQIKGSIFNIESKAMNYAVQHKMLVSVLLLGKSSFISEHLFGARELKYICNKNHHAVFLLNPRKDLYIPCI